MKDKAFLPKYKKCKIRAKMCETCAFRDESIESRSGMLRDDLMPKFAESKSPFLCHETMLQLPNDDFVELKKIASKAFKSQNQKWISNFDPTKNRKGEDVELSEHHICAGYAKFFAKRFKKKVTKNIPIENHFYKNVIEDREVNYED